MEQKKDNSARYKLIYFALLEAAMRYKEGFWREDLEANKQLLTNESYGATLEQKLSPSQIKKFEKKMKGLHLDLETQTLKINNIFYKEVEDIRKQFSDKADNVFDTYATGFGLIMEHYLDAKSTGDLLLLCSAYNKGLLDMAIEEIRKANMAPYPQTEGPERVENEVKPSVAPAPVIEGEKRDVYSHNS